MTMKLLKFGNGNAKLGTKIKTFSLPAGHSCPFAKDCLSKSDKDTGKITDGLHTEFRCFAASSEAVYTNTRLARWHNFDLLRGLGALDSANLIQASIPKGTLYMRIHVSGDFFSQAYFDAWIIVAKSNPHILFYAYTKSIGYWINRQNDIPSNLVLTASIGGKLDLIAEINNLKTARVVYSVEEADALGLEIDHDDSHAMIGGKSFALLIHGTQPPSSKGAIAMKQMKKEGVKFSYSK